MLIYPVFLFLLFRNITFLESIFLGHEILSEPPRGVAWLALTGGVLPC